jgi:hypothetical protein
MIYPAATVAFTDDAALSLVALQPGLAVADSPDFITILPGHCLEFQPGPEVSLSLDPFSYVCLVGGQIDGGGFDNAYDRTLDGGGFSGENILQADAGGF